MLSAIEGTDFGKYVEKIAREIWNKKALEQGFDPTLVQAYGEKLSEAVTNGYGKDFLEISFKDKDFNMLKNLHIDAWKFSTGKANAHLNDISKALRKPDGSLRSFEEFRIQTVIATGKQLRGLKAEYNTAIASAQMASKWETIQRQKGTYPYLKFEAVEDDHTTALCNSLNGVIKHVDDPFWTKFYPPNHYNCRSTVRQLRNAPETEDKDIKEPNIPEMFKVNFVAQGQLFPPNHKYYGNTPNEVFNKVREHLPYELQFDKVELPKEAKGYLQQHFYVNKKESDYKRVFDIAKEKAAKGAKVEILPALNPTEYGYDIRKIVFPDAKDRVSPDLRINGVLWEEEAITLLGKNTISNAIRAGARQANHVIVSLNVGKYPGDAYLENVAKGRFKLKRELEVIEFRHEEKTYIIKNPYNNKADQ